MSTPPVSRGRGEEDMDDGERIASGGISLQGWPIGEKADVGAECAGGAVADEGKDYE